MCGGTATVAVHNTIKHTNNFCNCIRNYHNLLHSDYFGNNIVFCDSIRNVHANDLADNYFVSNNNGNKVWHSYSHADNHINSDFLRYCIQLCFYN